MDPEMFDEDPRNAPRVRILTHNQLRPGTYPMRPFYYPPYYPMPTPAPVYQPPVVVQSPRGRGGRFAELTNAQVIELAAQAFAAFQSLPTAPTALGKIEDDVSNLITYQSALATHAKRDEQLRTIGSLVAKLLA